MARLRTLKPGFFTNEILAEVPPLGRLLFQGLWCLADREGRLEDRPRKLKAEILPYDDCDADVLLDMLAERDFIRRYAADNHRYIQVQNFAKHQSPHKMEAQSTIPAPCEHDASTVQAQFFDGLIVGSGIPEPVPPHTPPPGGEEAPSPEEETPPEPVRLHPAPKPTTLNDEQQARFDRWYATYPNKQHRPDAEKAWRKLDPDDAITATLLADVQRRKGGRKWGEGFVELPATYLNQRIWEDDIEPFRLTRPTQADHNSASRGKLVT